MPAAEAAASPGASGSWSDSSTSAAAVSTAATAGCVVGVGGLVAHRCKPHDGAGLDESGLDGRDASLTGKRKIGRFTVSF